MPDPQMTKAETKPKSENAKKEHKQDFYNLIIGFEVNTPEAFGPSIWFPGVQVHKINKDPGHTFMYITKNYMIMFFFSLGPGKEGHSSIRERAYSQGKPNYHIEEETRLFRFSITESQYQKMLSKGMEYTKDIESGKRYYDITKNFTCARAARDIIKEGWPTVPLGESFIEYIAIKLSGTFVNPYAFYRDIKKAFPREEVQLSKREMTWFVIMSNTVESPGSVKDPILAPHLWETLDIPMRAKRLPLSHIWRQGQVFK